MPYSEIKTSIQQQFGDVASKYASSKVHVSGADLDAMLKIVQLTGDERILDAGCGAGHASMAFSPYVSEVVAYDLTESMLATVEQLANERGISNIRTQQGDVEALPFDRSEFDLVISRYSAHHWPAPGRAIVGFYHVLKPGGVFILSDIVATHNYMQDTVLQTVEILRDPSHVRDYRIDEWRHFLEQAGFSFKLVFETSIKLDFVSWLDRMNTPNDNAMMIRKVFSAMPSEIQSMFGIDEAQYEQKNFVFQIPGVVIAGQR